MGSKLGIVTVLFYIVFLYVQCASIRHKRFLQFSTRKIHKMAKEKLAHRFLLNQGSKIVHKNKQSNPM